WDLHGDGAPQSVHVSWPTTAPVLARCLAATPDGRALATGAIGEREIVVWDTQTGARIGSVTTPFVNLSSIALSPDATRVVAAGLDEGVRVWEVATGKELYQL